MVSKLEVTLVKNTASNLENNPINVRSDSDFPD